MIEDVQCPKLISNMQKKNPHEKCIFKDVSQFTKSKFKMLKYVFQFLMEHPIRRIVYSEKQPKVHMESALRMITFHVLWGIVQMVQIFSVPNSICMKSRKIITFKYILSKSKNANGKNWFIIGTHIWNILHTFYDDICFVSCFRSFHLICYCKEV